MTHRTHAVAKTRAHQVRWSSRCRSRAAGSGASAAAGARVAAAAGQGRATQLRLSSASTLINGSPQQQRFSHALLRPQKSEFFPKHFSQFLYHFSMFRGPDILKESKMQHHQSPFAILPLGRELIY